jgi:Ser/Thr protein kinase RdoA (MazF antagonist)
MAHPFETLTPDLVLDAVESIGYLSAMRAYWPLNSYENRVYQVGIEDERAADRQVLPAASAGATKRSSKNTASPSNWPSAMCRWSRR